MPDRTREPEHRGCGPDGTLARRIIGHSPALHAVRERIRQVARYDVTVSIYGETGTGKELVAHALHYCSPRADGPFVPVNCGAMPDQLVDSELFGHRRGAFTDAREDRDGLIFQANGGTLFLDEIEALSPRAQVLLLRFLQDRRFRRVGGRRLREADVRLVVASNMRLESMQRDPGRFRPDLYYRLNVLPIDLPPLRERGEDIVLLAGHFLTKYCARHGLPHKRLSADALRWIAAHDWPGNVRELENAVHRGVLLAPGAEVGPQHLADAAPESLPAEADEPVCALPFSTAKARAIEAFERRYLKQLLAECSGNVTAAARRAATERRTLGRLIKKHGLRRTDERDA